jgi:rhodanese-related sulfurtransferase
MKKEIIDVREKEDFEREHIPEAKSMPLSRLKDEMKQLDIANSIVIVCNRGGKRSKEAYDLLKNQGYKDVTILEGGMEHWRKNES